MLTLPPLGLYVHLPWCVRKCPYCDFNSHEYRDREGRGAAPPFEAYVDALIADLDFDLPLVWGRTVHSVFFGGGTPSLFPAAAIDRLLQAVRARLRFAPECEITLETNPGTAEHGRFEDYRKAGVNRLSFGIQSFDDDCLRRLGRIHDSRQAEAAVKLAQEAGFDDINLDLMYALPGQTAEMAERDLRRAFALGPTHLSHYQLTLEPNTLFAARPPAGIPDEDQAWDIQERCQALLAQAGYVQYEISAYARPGRQCAHNLNYWRFGDYLGIGAGAHGKISLPDEAGDASGRILRRWKHKHPAAYLARAGTAAAIGADQADAGQRDAGRGGIDSGGTDQFIPKAQRPFEFMLNALRLREGFSLTQFEARTGLPRGAIADPLARAKTAGWLVEREDRVTPTETGLHFANDVISLFLVEFPPASGVE